MEMKKFLAVCGSSLLTVLLLAVAVCAQEVKTDYFTQRAVKPRPSGRGYKAHLNWNFCL